MKIMFNAAKQYKESNAFFDEEKYEELLKRDILDIINYKIWKFREEESNKFSSTYAMCNHLMKYLEGAFNEQD